MLCNTRAEKSTSYCSSGCVFWVGFMGKAGLKRAYKIRQTHRTMRK